MTSYEQIVAKQIQWALNRGLHLVGSQLTRGRPTYTPKLDQNLFQPLLPTVQRQLMEGDGSELQREGAQYPGKMQAVHSSSALGVNVFQYWMACADVSAIAIACRLCRPGTSSPNEIAFEQKFVISEQFDHAPNLDVVMRYSDKTKPVLAVESKFTEAYGSRKHSGLRVPYLKLPGVWDDIPNLRRLAQSISPEDIEFKHLHPAQLIKHILGLKQIAGLEGFRLLYLWYDALGEDGAAHRREVERFSELAKSDGIGFYSVTHQELIMNLARQHRPQHEAYIRYLTERYL